jgi:hypothetical protein
MSHTRKKHQPSQAQQLLAVGTTLSLLLSMGVNENELADYRARRALEVEKANEDMIKAAQKDADRALKKASHQKQEKHLPPIHHSNPSRGYKR